MTKGMKVGLLGSPLRWAGLSATILAAPASLAADCPTPVLEQCANVDYRSSSCGQAHDAYCQDLTESEWKARWELAAKKVVLLPEELGGKTATVATQPVKLGTTRFTGMDQGLAGQVLKGQVLYRKRLENLTKAEKAYLIQLEAWDKNGTQITSCQEFVDEKYLGYSRFERLAGQYGDDYRALFNAAYGANGIANRTLYSRDQKKLAPIWADQAVAKNAYFEFAPGPYPDGINGYEFTSEAASLANNEEARKWATPTDAWHESMSKQLSKTPDDVLTVRQEEQEVFTALLRRREAVYAEWQQAVLIFKKQDQDPKELNNQVGEHLYMLDKAIEERLVKAQEQGCLDTSNVTSCDWSPRRYKGQLEAAMAPRRAADLQACLNLTGNDFSEQSFVRNADLLKLSTLKQKDYTLSSSLLTQYLNIYGAHIAALDVPVDPSSGLVRHGGEHGDSGYSGDSMFGGGYDYKAGWEITAPGADLKAKGFGFAGPWCDYNARLYAEFNAYVNVFSPTPFEVVHVHGGAGTEGNGIRLQLGARVLGLSVYNHDMHYPLRITFAEDKPFFKSDAAQASTTFLVWFIPVTVKGGVSAETGIKISLGGAVTRDCAADLLGVDLFGTVTPYLTVNGFASVGIGIPQFQVAVRGEVVLTRVNLPLYSDIGLYLSSGSHPTNPNTLFLRLTSKLDIEARFLDGRIMLYAELGPAHAEFPIFSWSGFGMKHNIYTQQVTVPVAQLF
ncbi:MULTISPECIES: hypothetical protein [Myxococcus]|uniref:hypothetical protein n=1 Tax=Myxococcus TaxID=32 RepID=UPI00157AEE58|nr:MULTISPECIES: hypothetical protein [Myxococcus]NTX01198.1 hypothetical protein [Myxococcus sp. CA040A]